MAIFATDNEFNIQNEEITGFYKKPPKKPKLWAYLFWIAILVFIITLLWSAFISHAQVNVIISQQALNATSTTGGAHGQVNFDYLYNGTAFTASSTYSSLTLMLGYGDAVDLVNGYSLAGRTHSVCFFTIQPSFGYWLGQTYGDTQPLGCLSHTITSDDMATTTLAQKTFTGSVVLPPNGSSTQQPTYWFVSYGIMSATSTNPGDWANSTHGLIFGGTTNTGLGGSIPQVSAGVGGTTYAWQPANFTDNNMMELFFILNGNVGVGGLNITTCEGGGAFDNLLCNLYVSLFIPSDTALNQFSGLWDNIKNKPPFGYFVAINTAISGLAVGTTTLTFTGISDISIFSTMRLLLNTVFWFLFAFWIFHRLRNFNF